MKKNVQLLALFLFVGLGTYAQPSGETDLTGLVHNEEGVPLYGVQIYSYQNGRVLNGTITDLYGYYEITANSDSIRISYLGYEDQLFSPENLSRNPVIQLKQASYNLSTVIVLAPGKKRDSGIICPYILRPQELKNEIPITIGLVPREWSVYPNPTIREVRVRTEGLNGQITVVSIEGEVLINVRINGPQTMVDLGGVPSGTYFLRYENEGWIETIGQVMKLNR